MLSTAERSGDVIRFSESLAAATATAHVQAPLGSPFWPCASYIDASGPLAYRKRLEPAPTPCANGRQQIHFARILFFTISRSWKVCLMAFECMGRMMLGYVSQEGL